MKFAVSPEAARDLDRLRAFLAEKDSGAAKNATAVLESAIGSLADFPERGRPSQVPGLRELVVAFGRSSYVIRYSHLAATQTILIVRVWHGRETRE